jgi:hypothetical protein
MHCVARRACGIAGSVCCALSRALRGIARGAGSIARRAGGIAGGVRRALRGVTRCSGGILCGIIRTVTASYKPRKREPEKR